MNRFRLQRISHSTNNRRARCEPLESRLLLSAVWTWDLEKPRPDDQSSDIGSPDPTMITVHGTPGNDRFEFNVQTRRLLFNGWSHVAGAEVRVVQFLEDQGDRGGIDLAVVRGCAGDDTLDAASGAIEFTSGGIAVRISGAEQLQAYAVPGGHDRAVLHDSAGRDTLVSRAGAVTLSGEGYLHRVAAFDEVYARSATGDDDQAMFYDGAARDVFVGRLGSAAMHRGEIYHQAENFEAVAASSHGGVYDEARLYDSCGDDRLVSRVDNTLLSGEGYYIRVKGFAQVDAFATVGGHDSAVVIDAPGDDLVVARPDGCRIQSGEILRTLSQFENIDVESRYRGEERAVLLDDGQKELLVDGDGRAEWSTAVVDYTFTRFDDIRTRAGRVVEAADFFDPQCPTQGIQEAIDSLPPEGGIVELAAQTYELRQGLTLRSGVTLRGRGDTTVLARPPLVSARLTRPAQNGDLQLWVDSSDGFRPGDELFLVCDRATLNETVQATVASVEAGVIRLLQPLEVSFAFEPDDGAAVANIFPLLHAAPTDGVPPHEIVVEELKLTVATRSRRFIPARSPAAIEFSGAFDSDIRHSTIVGAAGPGIRLTQGHDNRIEAVEVSSTHWSGVMLVGEIRTAVRHSTVRDTGFDGIIALQGSDIRIEATLSSGNRAHGLHLGEGVRDAVVTGNTSVGNQISGLFFCFDVLRAAVARNRFEENADSGISGLGWGGRFGDRYNLIAGNTLRANGRWGLIAVESVNNTIRDNVILDNSQAEPGRFSGVTLFASTYTTVAGNLVGSTLETPTQIFGIEESPGSDANWIFANDCRGNLQAGIVRAGPRTRIDGNLGEVLNVDG